jgi:hypothetical protein
MSRREARIAREAAERLKEIEKSARLRARLPVDPIRVGAKVRAAKQVRIGANPGSVFGMQMTWTCSAPDCDGGWSWGTERQWTDVAWSGLIEPKLKEWERLVWSEIDRLSSDSGHKMHHNMATDAICEEAQLRMIEIEKYDPTYSGFA